MKCRFLFIWVVLFCTSLFIVQGCAQKKTYTVGKPEGETARLIFPNYIEIGSFDGECGKPVYSNYL